MPEMGWEETRVALNRLLVETPGEAHDYIALAEFALSACGFEGFDGRKSDNAVKSAALGRALERLQQRLRDRLGEVAQNAETLARPISAHLDGACRTRLGSGPGRPAGDEAAVALRAVG